MCEGSFVEKSNTSKGGLPTQSDLYCAARYIRMELKNVKSNLTDPPSAKTLTLNHAQIPTAVYNFLVWMMSDDTDGTDLHRRVMAVGQDLLYNVSRGRVKTPKHVSLAMAVKNLTGSSQVVSLLNRFGHTVSYNELLYLESSIALKTVQKEREQVTVPSNIRPHVFASVVLCAAIYG